MRTWIEYRPKLNSLFCCLRDPACVSSAARSLHSVGCTILRSLRSDLFWNSSTINPDVTADSLRQGIFSSGGSRGQKLYVPSFNFSNFFRDVRDWCQINPCNEPLTLRNILASTESRMFLGNLYTILAMSPTKSSPFEPRMMQHKAAPFLCGA